MMRYRNFIVACLFSPVILANGISELRADEPISSTSIRLAPVDADFYSATYRMKEQWESFVAGPVAKKFMALPVVQENFSTFLEQWQNREGNVANIRAVWENPNAKEAIQFATDLMSDEVFMLGDKNLGAFVQSYSRAMLGIGEITRASLKDAKDQSALIAWIDELEDLKIPNLILGAKFKNEDLAITKVDQLEATLQLSMGFIPELAPVTKGIKRVDDDRGSRLTLELSGKMIPWDTVPINEPFDEEIMGVLAGVLKEKTLTITIGTLDSYFIVGISAKRADLLSLGKGPSLYSHADLAPIVANASKSITSVSYMSDNFAKANFDAQFKDFFTKNFSSIIDQFLGVQTLIRGNAGSIDKNSEVQEFFQSVKADLQWMDETIAKFVPEARGMTSMSYATPTGWEQWVYARTKNVLLDGAKPLGALQHLGGDPMMMVVTRLQDRPEYFGLMRQIVQRFKKQLDRAFKIDWDEVGVGSEDLKRAQTEVDALWPLLVRLADAWEKYVLPGFSGEHGVSMSTGNLVAKQWAKEMPPSDEPLALPEMAFISGTRDASKLHDGARELFAVCDLLLEYIRSKDRNAIPANYSIPRPTETKSSNGVKFGYPIPDDCPAPKSMMPHGLFTGDYLYGSYSNQQSETLAKSTQLSIGAGVIDANKPIANASYLNVGRIMKSVKPWVVYAVKQTVKDLDASLEDPSVEGLEDYAVTTNDLLSVWGVLETIGDFSSTTEIGSDGTTTTRAVYRSMSK